MSNEVNGVNGTEQVVVNPQTQGAGAQQNTGAANAFEDADITLGTDADSFVPSSATDKKIEPKNTQKTDDGKDYVEVQAWGTGKDDCLSRIVQAHYGVNPYSKEGQAIMQAVIAANPQIYDSGRQAIVDGKKVTATDANKTETIIRTGEKVYLPPTTGDSAAAYAPSNNNTGSNQPDITTYSNPPSNNDNSWSIRISGIDDFLTRY